MLVLLDTGILLRLFDATDPYYQSIVNCIRALSGQGDKLVFAPQNAAEFWNVCTRPATVRGGLGLDPHETDRRLTLLESAFALLSEPATAYAIWRQLCISHFVQGRQAHDARLVAVMLANGVRHILTLNGSDFARYPAINVIDLSSQSSSAAPP